MQNLHLCTFKSVSLTKFGPFGANFSQQLILQTQLAKIRNKKVIAENQCVKQIKKIEFSILIEFTTWFITAHIQLGYNLEF